MHVSFKCVYSLFQIINRRPIIYVSKLEIKTKKNVNFTKPSVMLKVLRMLTVKNTIPEMI